MVPVPESAKMPFDIVVVPVYVFVLDRVRVLSPDFIRDPVPDIIELYVISEDVFQFIVPLLVISQV